MSTSVCLSVCSSATISPQPYVWSLPIFCACACCLWPWLGPPPAGWRNPKGNGQFGVWIPHWQCIVPHSIWDPYKTAEPIEMPFGMMSGLGGFGLRNSVTWRWRSPKGKGQFWGKTCQPSLIPVIIANSTGLCSGTWWADVSLQALDESIIGREVGVYFRSCGWHHVFFYNGPYSGINFTTNDLLGLSTYIWQKNQIFLSMRSVLWPRICRTCDSVWISPRTPLGELTTLPRPSSRLGRGHPSPNPPHSAPRPSRLRRSGLSPTYNLWLRHW